MTLTELRYVVTLARERHFGRAAERCHVSQPTLSVAVKKLEDELGIPLFERSKSSIRVTETGQRIIEQAQRVLDQVGVIKDMAQDGKNQLNSPLKVGAIYTIGPYLFPHLLPELRRAAPEMPLYIEENYTANLRQKLRHSDLDAIIIALPFEEPEVVTMPLYDEPFVVLLPADHPLTAKDEITADELSREQLLIRSRLKLFSIRKNAQALLAFEAQGGHFVDFIWSFVDGKPVINTPVRMADISTQTSASEAMSKALKKLGFSFVGPTICYAYMQSMGLVNDHFINCPKHPNNL